VTVDRARPITALIAAVLLVAAAGGIFYAIWRGLSDLNPGTAAAVVTASATVLVSVASLIVSKRWEQRLAIAEAQREHKRAVYEEFMQFYFSLLTPRGAGVESAFDPEKLDSLQRMNQKLILWASDDVLALFNRFRTAALAAPADGSVDVVLDWEQVLYAIRRDLGHRNEGLISRDLLRLFLNDVDSDDDPGRQRLAA
jgi:hypothetical protein